MLEPNLLKKDNVMFPRLKLDRVEYPIDKIQSMTRDEGRDVEVALLQSLLRIEKIEGVLDLSPHGFVTRNLRSVEPGSQSVDLIIYFSPAFFQRVRQGRVRAPQLILQSVELSIKSLGGMFECRRSFLAQILFDDPRDDVIHTCKEVLQANAVTLKRTPGVLLDKSQTRAWENWRRWAIEKAIDLGRLREISNFRRAAVIGNRRQQVILDHGVQNYVQTKAIGLAQSPVGKFIS